MAARRVEAYLHILLFRAGAGMPGMRRASDSGAVVAGFGGVLPGIGLEWRKRALEKSVIDDVAFAVLSADDPIAALDVAEAEIGGNRLIFLALCGIDKQGAACAKSTHDS